MYERFVDEVFDELAGELEPAAEAVDACTTLPKSTRLAFRPQNGWLPVKSTTVAPYRYICNIVSFFESECVPFISASGVLIGDGLVLTAAHNLLLTEDDKDLTSHEVWVVPGNNNGRQPFGSTPASKIIVPIRYKPPKILSNCKLDLGAVEFEQDFALILTKDKIGQTNPYDPTKPGAGFWGQGIKAYDFLGTSLGAIAGWRSGHYNVNICAYPTIKGGNAPWYSYDATLKGASAPDLLFVRNKVCHGHSGSPVWVKRSRASGGRVLFAIWVGFQFLGSNKIQACGRLIDKEVLEFIEDIRMGRTAGTQISL